MRVTVVHNPEAGDDALDRPALQALLEAAGYRATFHSTKAKTWKRALADPGDLVVVAGGDGTVAKVARRIAGRGIPMALLPAGTANNIAASLGITGDTESLIARWAAARVTPMDLGIIDGSTGERCFIESVGLGALPVLMDESERRIPKNDTPADEQIRRNVELLIELIEAAAPIPCRVTADGRDLSGSYLALEVLNIRSVGPRIIFAPDADPTDGLLDIVAVRESDRPDVIDFLRRFRGGAADGFDVPRVSARDVRIAWDSHRLHIDDSRWPSSELASAAGDAYSVRVSLAAGAVEILL